MSIRLYEHKRFRGDDMVVTANEARLRGTEVGDRPSSIKMTENDDAVLLCKNQNWGGGVFYLRGQAEIEDLGSRKKGGKSTYGNSVSSVRVTPFRLKLNVTIVADGDGDVNGILSSRRTRESRVEALVDDANDFFDRQSALLRLELSGCRTRKDAKRFNMSDAESRVLPRSWKKRGELDMIFINRFDGGHVGLGKFPHWGKVTLCTMMNGSSVRSFDAVARTFVHEIGHYFGLRHQSHPSNIMTQSSTGDPLAVSRMTDDQIEDVHQKLARNLARKADRIE